jgi:hypothetical protein
VRPSIWGATPRRVTSTSGNSGMNEPHPFQNMGVRRGWTIKFVASMTVFMDHQTRSI